MRDPAVEAISKLKEMLDDHAHGNMQRAGGDVFEHGRVVGIYQGMQVAIQVIQNALSAGDEADTKL
jgi:hypothetical protein